LTLESNFKIPFYRDVLLSLGICSVSKTSCRNILAKGPGNAITIVIGGAAESLSAHPGTADLTLKKRFGFVKIAIREGADLVPVFSFGENDVSCISR
jgi:2-acylglycerol O-acyltransferase 2